MAVYPVEHPVVSRTDAKPREKSVDNYISQNQYLLAGKDEPVNPRSSFDQLGPFARKYRPLSRLTSDDVWKQPLPYMNGELKEFQLRLVFRAARHYVLDLQGSLDNIHPRNDPFIVVINHSQRFEAVLIPSILFFYRLGKPIHFMADWQFLIMPFVASLYRLSQVIVITNKDIKPKFLNVIKPLFRQKGSAFERAALRLQAGSPVGIFPEGTINRDPHRLMRGLPGGAKLAVETGVPVLPIGLRFPELEPGQPVPDGAKMTMHIGEFIHPPEASGNQSRQDSRTISQFHGTIMEAISGLCGKTWDARANKRRRYVV
jgi:1-acyl-sn-glycerol-3-phosphate acyltransferase